MNAAGAGEVAVVTGAARGFGLEIARRLAARGYVLVLTDIDEQALRAAAAGLGPAAHPMLGDARDPATHEATAAAAAGLGRLTVWVNNAGVIPAGKAWEHTGDEMARNVELNLLGVMYGSRAAVQTMRSQRISRRRPGHLLNIASIAAFGPIPGLALYAAAKAGVLNFTSSLQGDLDLARVPIRVHALCPHAADTRATQGVAGSKDAALMFHRTLFTSSAVAEEAVGMLEGRRIVRGMPWTWTAALRIGSLAPRFGLKVLTGLRWIGDRRRVARSR